MSQTADPSDPSTLVLFDLDGTITDSFEGIANSFRHALGVVGVGEPDPAVVAGIAGPPMLDTLRTLGLDDETADRAMFAYRDRYTQIGWLENSVFPGMADLLTDLHGAGRRLAITTSKNQTTARRILTHFGLADRFVVIAGAGDDGVRRSKSDVVRHALDRLGVPVTIAAAGGTPGVVIVGDRSHDVHGAGEFGVPAVFVEWGYALDGEAADARWVVSTVDDLRKLLNG